MSFKGNWSVGVLPHAASIDIYFFNNAHYEVCDQVNIASTLFANNQS